MQPVSFDALDVDLVHHVLRFLKLTRANLLAVRAVSQYWESCAECFLPWHTFLPLSADGLLNVFAQAGPVPPIRLWVDVRGCAAANTFHDQQNGVVRRLLRTGQPIILLTDTFTDVSRGFQDPPHFGTNVVIKQHPGVQELLKVEEAIFFDLGFPLYGFEGFRAALLRSSASLAGGWVLKTCLSAFGEAWEAETADLDIFCSCAFDSSPNLQPIYRIFEQSRWKITAVERSRYSPARLFRCTKEGLIKVDLVFTTRSVLATVGAFDLTCCRIWYDGNSVQATHWHWTLRGITTILPSATEQRQARINKYKDRGFTVIEEDFE
jgi:hypothetical protein